LGECITKYSERMIPYFDQRFIFKSNKYWVYFNRYFIPNGEITRSSIYEAQELLLRKMMVRCRSVKIDLLNKQINKIQQLKFDF
jgi:hypothetical protein